MNRRVILLVIATALLVIPYAIHIVGHYIDSGQRQRITGRFAVVTYRSADDLDSERHESFPITFEAPLAVYTGMSYEIDLVEESKEGTNIKGWLLASVFNRGDAYNHNGVNYSDKEAAIVRALMSKYDSSNVFGVYDGLKCSIQAPDYSVVRLADCDFLVSAKTVGRPMLVVNVSGIGSFTNARIFAVDNPREDHRDYKYNPRLEARSTHVSVNIPVEAPIQSSVSTISTFLGIVTAVASFFFKNETATKPEDTATSKLLNDIAKRRRRE